MLASGCVVMAGAGIAPPFVTDVQPLVPFALVSTASVVLAGVLAFQAAEVEPARPTGARESTGLTRVPLAFMRCVWRSDAPRSVGVPLASAAESVARM